MAKILLGWEFGAGRGHYLALKTCADALAARGHEPVFAVKNPSLFVSEGFPVWQAPLSPRLLVNALQAPQRSPSTMGDILARLGFDDPAIVAGLALGWRQVLDAVRPDIVIGDFAPTLVRCARARSRTIHMGTGFAMPPSDMAAFPSLTSGQTESPEDQTLEATNQGLSRAGVVPLPALPALFAADMEIATTFAELDPYHPQRGPAVQPPFVPPRTEAGAGLGDEVFVYLQENVPPDAAVWAGLAQSKLPVRVYLPNATSAQIKVFHEFKFRIERSAVPFERIAARSRIVLSHGGHGFVCSALLAGLPQVICYHDLEKRLYANAIAAMRLGGHVQLAAVEPAAFAASLVQLYEDVALAERARAAAPRFRSRMTAPLAETISRDVEALLGA